MLVSYLKLLPLELIPIIYSYLVWGDEMLFDSDEFYHGLVKSIIKNGSNYVSEDNNYFLKHKDEEVHETMIFVSIKSSLFKKKEKKVRIDIDLRLCSYQFQEGERKRYRFYTYTDNKRINYEGMRKVFHELKRLGAKGLCRICYKRYCMDSHDLCLSCKNGNPPPHEKVPDEEILDEHVPINVIKINTKKLKKVKYIKEKEMCEYCETRTVGRGSKLCYFCANTMILSEYRCKRDPF